MKRIISTIVSLTALLALGASAAHAQKWDITTVYQGKVSITGQADQPWKPDGSNISVTNQATGGTGVNSITSSGTVTYTFTWDAGTSGNPAPTNVYVVESGNEDAKVTTNNTSAPPQVYQPTYTATTSSDVPNLVATDTVIGSPTYPTGREEKRTQSKVSWVTISAGSSFTKTFNISSSASVNYNGNSGLSFITVSLGASASIHATPYNLVKMMISVQSGTNAGQPTTALYTVYNYDSTSGKLSDLTSCKQHELIHYEGDNPFIPPAPFTGSYPNDFTYDAPNDPNQIMTTGVITDGNQQFSSAAPFMNASFTTDQTWQYNDSFTGETNVEIPSTAGVSFSYIVRECAIAHAPDVDAAHDGWWATSVEKFGVKWWLPVGPATH